MRTFTKQASEVRRQALLEAASRLFRAHGYAGTQMSAIAAEAGLSKGGAYFHFPSKQAVLLAALAFEAEQFDQRLRERAEQAPDAPTRLMLYITGHLDASDTDLPLDLWVEALRVPEGVALLREAYRRVREQVATLLADGGRGAPNATHRAAAALVVALLDGLDLQAAIDPEAAPNPALLKEAALKMVRALTQADE